MQGPAYADEAGVVNLVRKDGDDGNDPLVDAIPPVRRSPLPRHHTAPGSANNAGSSSARPPGSTTTAGSASPTNDATTSTKLSSRSAAAWSASSSSKPRSHS